MTPMDSAMAADLDRVQEGDARLVQALLANPRFLRLAGAAAPEIFHMLAGSGRLYSLLARSAGRRIQSGCLARARKIEQQGSALLGLDSAVSVQIIDLVADLWNRSLEAWEQLPPVEQKALMAHLTQRIDTAGLGRMLTAMLQLAQADGDSHSLLQDKLTAFLEATDFGELVDATAAARQRLLPLWETVVETTWSYPSKVVCLLAVLPSLAGLALDATDRGLAPFNRLPPDMLVDVVASLIKDLDARSVGTVVNQGSELVRKIQVGSTLIGNPGTPELPETIDRLMDTVCDTVDRQALAAAREKMALLAESLAEKRTERLERQPEWNAAGLKATLKTISRQARNLERQVRLWEALPSDEAVAEAVAEGLADLDAGGLADTCNRCIDLAGRVMDVRPDLAPRLFGAFAEEIDMDAVARCLALAAPFKESGNGFDDLLAPLIHGLADQVETKPGGDLAGALHRLGKVMVGS